MVNKYNLELSEDEYNSLLKRIDSLYESNDLHLDAIKYRLRTMMPIPKSIIISSTSLGEFKKQWNEAMQSSNWRKMPI